MKRILYYAVRCAQRLSLLALLLATGIYWMLNISIATTVSAKTVYTVKDKDAGGRFSDVATQAVNIQANTVLRAAIFAGFITLLLLAFVRVRKQEKRLIADSAVVIVFCLLATMLCQSMIRQFITRIG